MGSESLFRDCFQVNALCGGMQRLRLILSSAQCTPRAFCLLTRAHFYNMEASWSTSRLLARPAALAFALLGVGGRHHAGLGYSLGPNPVP